MTTTPNDSSEASRPATTEQLRNLYILLLDALVEDLRAGVRTASFLDVVRAFLRDNHVEADPGDPQTQERLQELAAALSLPFTT